MEVLQGLMAVQVRLDEGAHLVGLQGLLCARVVPGHARVLVARGINEPPVLAGNVHPDDARLAVEGDPLHNVGQVGPNRNRDRVIRHPGPARSLWVVGVPIRKRLWVLEVEEFLVVHLTDQQLSAATDISADYADADQISDISDINTRQMGTCPTVEDFPDSRV
jgi:hypothetical protein